MNEIHYVLLIRINQNIQLHTGFDSGYKHVSFVTPYKVKKLFTNIQQDFRVKCVIAYLQLCENYMIISKTNYINMCIEVIFNIHYIITLLKLKHIHNELKKILLYNNLMIFFNEMNTIKRYYFF